MQVEQWTVVAAAAVAAAALVLVLVQARQLRRMRADVQRLTGDRSPEIVPRTEEDQPRSAGRHVGEPVPVVTSLPADRAAPDRDDAVVLTRDGRTIVLPSTEQVVEATMSRPMVRGAVLSHGIWHALRPESRDRISGLVRREYRARRKARIRAGRAAARTAPLGRTQSQSWLGSHGSMGGRP